MHAGTPEAYLKALIRRLRAVDVATSHLSEDERKVFLPELLRSMRDCQMTSLLYDHTVVAVAGHQGAGKTMLIRQLYDLGTEWLCDNPGRGESLPVLVLEDPDASAPQGYNFDADDSGAVNAANGTPVSPERFREALTTWGDGLSLRLPVLRVPTRYGGGTRNSGFLLLPGYEMITSENRVWQDFMRAALVASSACVLVTNERLLARQQDVIIADLKQKQLAGVEPVVAITNTEGMSEERLEELRRTAVERFGVPLDGTVCTGTENVNNWREQMLVALSRHGGIGVDARVRQIEDLDRLSQRIGGVVSAAKRAVRVRTDQSDDEDMLAEVVEALDQEVEKVRDDYERRLDSKLRNIAAAAKEEARTDYEATETGWSAWGTWVRELASLEGHKGARRMTDRLRSAVEKNGGGAAFAPTHAAMLADLSREHSKLPDPAVLAVDGPPADQLSVETRPVDGGSHALATLGTLLSSGRRDDALELTRPQAQTLRQDIALLPVIATTYMSAMQTAVALSPTGARTIDLGDLLQNATGKTTEMSGLTKGLIKAAAAVLVIDVADGEIDSVPGLVQGVATLVGGSGAPVGATATAVAGVAAIALAGSVVAYAALDTLNRHQMNVAAQVESAIEDAIRDQKMRHLASFDEMMSLLRGKIEQQLQIVLRIDEAVGLRLRAWLAVQDLGEARARFKEEVGAGRA